MFGDCSKTTGFKSSTPGGPLKKIERRLKKKKNEAYEVNENYSTKASVCCHGHKNKKMTNGYSEEKYKNGKAKYCPREIHGILHCENCSRTWNRDWVGSINIYDIFVATLNQQARPYRFTKDCHAAPKDSSRIMGVGNAGVAPGTLKSNMSFVPNTGFD